MSAPPLAQAKINERGLDWVCDRLANGVTMTAISDELDVSIGSLLTWCAQPEHSARVIESRAMAASVWDEKAEQGLEDAADPFELSKHKELAHHYRWRASKIAPRIYGDRIQQEHSGKDGAPIIIKIDTGVPVKPSDA